MKELIQSLIKDGYLKTPGIIEAFRTIHREDFLPEDMKGSGDMNTALSIGYGQTCSQPLTVAFLLELLEPEPGHRVLDIGSGSGWTTALLAHIVESELAKERESELSGRVFAIERIPALCRFGEENVRKYGFVEKGIAQFFCQDGSRGLPQEAPFDRVLASASADQIPEAWKEQLAPGGRLVSPVRSSVWLFEKRRDGSFRKQEHPGFAFVPLVSGEETS